MVVEVISVNYLSILGAAVVSFIFGGIWYSFLFERTWEKLSKTRMGVGKPRWALLLTNFIASLIIAWVLVHTLVYAGVASITDALFVTFFTWLGYFALTTSLGLYLWMGKPFKLYLIEAGFWLINLMLMAIVLTVWS